MTRNAHIPVKIWKRGLQCFLIAALSTWALYHLGWNLAAQYHVQQADQLARTGYYGLSASHLKKAADIDRNNPDIQHRLGDAWLHLASLALNADDAFHMGRLSKQSYARSAELNPIDSESRYGMARAESFLQQLDRRLYPEAPAGSYRPLPFYREAIRLRPNSIRFHYALALYLADQSQEPDLLSEIGTMARIYPSCIQRLKAEPFWSEEASQRARKGAEAATRDGGPVAEAACKALSSLAADENDWAGALVYYEKALEESTTARRPEDEMHLGWLCLKSRDFDKAAAVFANVLDNSHPIAGALKRLYQLYRDEKASERFIALRSSVFRRFQHLPQVDILMARSYMDLKQYTQAVELLNRINNQEPVAEAFYWLAQIAQAEKRWDDMETDSQKATVLDPRNAQYHLMFSQALTRVNKLQRAENEAGLAIEYSSSPSASLYNHRAWLRWKQNNFSGAAEDWAAATVLKPDTASFHAQRAEAFVRLGNLSGAVRCYQQALACAPGNPHYRKRFQELTTRKTGIQDKDHDISEASL